MHAKQPIKIGIIVVAAGRGERAGSPEDGPKQYRPIGGKAIIAHTLEGFMTWRQALQIVVVIHRDDERLLAKALGGISEAASVSTVFGGETRQQSVLEGLRSLKAADVTHVLIHDAVRPFFNHTLLDEIMTALENGASAVLPAIQVADTLKRLGSVGLVVETVARAGLYAAQTPQAFELTAILAAHEKAALDGRSDFTDDASIAEWAGLPVQLVAGSPDNIKLTIARDISMADERMSANLPDVRTGNGYDVHQLEPGDGVTLCGIFLPHDQRLKGHSDADVALHALTDALLATCGAGDIGDHFPPSDPQWRGAASRIFIEHAARIVRDAGGTIMNADVTLIAEAPKIGPHRLEMRQKLSECLGISLDRCSVKATTNEEIGFIGRREGIAAIATATVVYRSNKP
ncbi:MULTISPECIES: bifunctional 2-C-methyl-D-erythritol 4-phosphate cytidylyltransferase/2-C-methyl-D-erythritol 2,4-cyclodiphosphate synthase [unclassified Rhizobium]|uniref:bifunctional 2-C-methyl-D-erythritol 4-phosphate cytidylyltransferase/2-C-methyl-D-erythritol 2,4-cyclodiphosphate synthase n=1 Tax=unclassified Rhizobium TaxID=2613769 RepID=UPI001ADA130C|nr:MULTISPECIES: bifunctional 2-C-methyl-D-erythritol 4-phosphate cytidylyltransferase/2-C-methyl-D-erythritol 2,4-cyclodiphosphate synthase [unclassified Rhizobium]MBO9098328.1 bifunctional 2-C-methyl-D-erythritol 4-phosphate cytidylyltransferase/2-C-methyl-D-erythritol 2,4-cyclodiphosphate synthase [Rhizobium sp. L58/93]MBO9132868.1 bifunctional 2-C-methyl-D-erythritol 4-phosphate cytidylyltransferase/2-C-methyl-D-erythritol 2,4-cyclodiphosphate synthase [Rhizobium sp. B209b/85]MBO9168594.1 bi